MLTSLKIKNFALIENAEVGFSKGLNVISGESGSGKSILIGALSVLLGERNDKDCIREGEKRCEIEATLTVPAEMQNDITKFFSEYDIENFGNEISIRRVIQENSARSYVNGSSLPVKAVRELASLFFDFNRPDEELSLNSQSRQLELLDRFGNISLDEYRICFANLESLNRKLADFDSMLPDESALEEAQELVSEMDKFKFSEDEEDQLIKRHKILSNAKELITSSTRASQILSGEENSIAEAFSSLMREFYAMDKLSEGALEKLINEAEEVNGALNSLQNSLDIFASGVELDGEALQEVENRLDALYRLKRRFGPSVIELFEHYDQAKEMLAKSQNGASCRRELCAKIASAEKELADAADKLTEKRQYAASLLENALLKELESLGFRKCRFEWSFSKIRFTINGADELDILFSANSGERVLPLRKIASSGERSRLFLAIKNALARVDDIPVVIFDEIDANIGGETANKVGDTLRELGRFRQIITISHLAQIACRADTHWKVEKHIRDDGRTVSQAYALDRNARINELARMLGNGDGAIEYAANIIQNAQ